MLNWEILFYITAFIGLYIFFRRPKDEKRPIPVEAVAITIAIYYTAQICGAFLAMIAPALAGWNTDRIVDWLQKDPFGQFLLISLIEAITVGMVIWYLKRHKTKPRDVGLVKPRWRDLGYVLGGFFVYFVVYFVLAIIVQQLAPDVDFNQKQRLGFQTASDLQLILVFISLVLLPPLTEELLMRGFLYSSLKKTLKFWPAALITSVLFGFAHLQSGSGAALLWAAALDTFVLSLVLVYLREKTGSLWPPIGLHMLKNGIAFMVLFVFHLV